MESSPELVSVVSVAAAAGLAYAYHRITGNRVEADIDMDGETDYVFEEHDDPSDHTTEEDIEFASEAAQEIGGELASVRGIGETRAEKLIEAGFETAEDLYFAADSKLIEIDGIGEATVEMIREDIDSVDDSGNSE